MRHGFFLILLVSLTSTLGGSEHPKPPEAGPEEWPGTVLPCERDDDCVKVRAFYKGCGVLYGYNEAIHRDEVETYVQMFHEYQEKREPYLEQPMMSRDPSCGWKVMPRCRQDRCSLIDEKGFIPKEELKNMHRTYYAPREYRRYTKEVLRTCSRDEDCVKVRAELCRARYDAVHRDFEALFRELRYQDVIPDTCPRIAADPTASASVVPICQAGQCTLTEATVEMR